MRVNQENPNYTSTNGHKSSFFRSALDRLSSRTRSKSSKSRSSSVPMRQFLLDNHLEMPANFQPEDDTDYNNVANDTPSTNFNPMANMKVKISFISIQKYQFKKWNKNFVIDMYLKFSYKKMQHKMLHLIIKFLGLLYLLLMYWTLMIEYWLKTNWKIWVWVLDFLSIW